MSLKAGLLAEAAPADTSRPVSPQRERSDGGAASIDEDTVCPVSLDHDAATAQQPPPARFPDGPPLRRAPSIEGIEHRAVSAAFLRRFTSSRVTADRSLARRCKKEGVKFLKDRIKELEEEHAALQARMQRSVVTGSLSRGLSAETLGSDDKLAQLDAPTVANVLLAGGNALDRAILLAAQTIRRRETTTLDEICEDELT